VPSDGLPHLGRAIAAAEQQDLGTAIRAMRSALQIDPSCLSRFQCGETTREQVKRLAHVLESLATIEPYRVVNPTDARFGSAMCQVLLKNRSEALERLSEDRGGTQLDAESQVLKELLQPSASNENVSPGATRTGVNEDAKTAHSP